MLRRFNTGYRDGEYSVPAGHLDGNETVLAAAAREAKEEIGVEFEAGAVAFSSVMHRTEDDERVDFFLHIAEWQGEPVNAEPDKCDEVCWVEVNNLPLNTIPYVRQAIQNHLHRVRFDEFGW